jgi:menaquinone-9 beta-reductase
MHASSKNYDVIIAGAGPAGTSAAIHLASHDLKVLLLEQKKFPREKLCGEFISPECLSHFKMLGVDVEMFASGPAEITETAFYSRHGKRIVVPSGWFGNSAAMGLSRAVMDQTLLSRAKAVGVDVLEEIAVSNLVEENGAVLGVRLKVGISEQEYLAPVTIDATGRARALSRRVRHSESRHASRSKLVAFKVHMTDTRVANGVCEIYSYNGGYGGVSTIEAGVSNLCFIVDAAAVRRAHSDPDVVLREIVMANPRAEYTLWSAKPTADWLSVALESFGRHKPSPAKGLLAIGDSASFIDPFTGSGMLMALESGHLVSEVIVRHSDKLENGTGETRIADIANDYNRAYADTFDSRLRVCGLLRRVAFKPALAQAVIKACSVSVRFRSRLARSTRASAKKNSASASVS